MKKTQLELIGRKRELEKLQAVLQSPLPQFIAVYGRRRVGKTFLIRSVFSSQTDYFEITGIKDGGLSEQLAKATGNLKNKFKTRQFTALANWHEYFEILTKEIEKNQKPFSLFIDELPWLATNKSNLLNELDYFWNTRWSKRKNLKVIICGSSSSWILDKIINATGGLYNRLTQSLRLEPFNLKDTQEYLLKRKIKYNYQDILELYMAIGGIPYYLDFINPHWSVAEAIENLIFRPDAMLAGEAENLFAALFQNHEQHEAIIRSLAKKRYGLSRAQITAETGLAGGSLHRLLNELSASSFIREYLPFEREKRDAYFRLTDEYTYFYYYWVGKLHKKILQFPRNYWQQKISTPAYSSWTGYSFESVCQKHLNSILRALGIEGLSVFASTWRNHPGKSKIAGAQIDLLLDRADRLINVCEIKYSREPLTINKKLIDEVGRKISVFKATTSTKKGINPVLISASGIISPKTTSSYFANIGSGADLFLD